MKFKGKLKIKLEKMAKKTNFEPECDPFWPKFGPQIFFSLVLPLLDVIHCYKLSLHAIKRKTNEPNLRKWQKNLVSGLILTPLAQIWFPKFFFVGFTSTKRYTLLQAITVCN